MTKVVALHGVESTGKSTLGARLAQDFGTICLPEYGREYCEVHGTDCNAEDLAVIAATQQAMIKAEFSNERSFIITDTDWLMTRAWHRMTLGVEMAGPAFPKADLYLHLTADVPWIDDGLRVHREIEVRHSFDAICQAELQYAGARWCKIAGNWDERYNAALTAIQATLGPL